MLTQFFPFYSGKNQNRYKNLKYIPEEILCIRFEVASTKYLSICDKILGDDQTAKTGQQFDLIKLC